MNEGAGGSAIKSGRKGVSAQCVLPLLLGHVCVAWSSRCDLLARRAPVSSLYPNEDGRQKVAKPIAGRAAERGHPRLHAANGEETLVFSVGGWLVVITLLARQHSCGKKMRPRAVALPAVFRGDFFLGVFREWVGVIRGDKPLAGDRNGGLTAEGSKHHPPLPW